MLKFIGNGSAFNSTSGNTSAYIDYGNDKILLDCGELVFAVLKDSAFWSGHTNVFITHNHPDHIGSLGSLIFYSFFIKKDTPTVYGNRDLKIILEKMGVADNMYNFVDIDSAKIFDFKGDNQFKDAYQIAHIPAKHVQNLSSVGYIIKENRSSLVNYYGGDASEIPSYILGKFTNGDIHFLYLDVSWLDYPDNVHMSYKKLCETIKIGRDRVYIMHMDENFNKDKAVSDGFKIAGKDV